MICWSIENYFYRINKLSVIGTTQDERQENSFKYQIKKLKYAVHYYYCFQFLPNCVKLNGTR